MIRMPTGMDFGEKLKRAIGGRSYSEIARVVGCSPETIRKIADHGSLPRLDRALRICRAVDIPIGWASDPETDWPPPVSEKDMAAELVSQALAGAGLAGELTDDERQLLSRWRQLNDRQQGRVLGMVEGLGESAADAAEEIPPHERIALDKVRDLVRRELDKRDKVDRERRGAG